MGVEVVIVLQAQVHLFDALAPDDVIVLPKAGHTDVLLHQSLLRVRPRADTSVAVVLAFVRDVTNTPTGRLPTLWLFEDFQPEMDGAISIIHRCRPVLGTLRIHHLPSHVVVRLVWLRIQRILLSEWESNIKKHKLISATERGTDDEENNGEQRGATGDHDSGGNGFTVPDNDAFVNVRG